MKVLIVCACIFESIVGDDPKERQMAAIGRGHFTAEERQQLHLEAIDYVLNLKPLVHLWKHRDFPKEGHMAYFHGTTFAYLYAMRNAKALIAGSKDEETLSELRYLETRFNGENTDLGDWMRAKTFLERIVKQQLPDPPDESDALEHTGLGVSWSWLPKSISIPTDVDVGTYTVKLSNGVLMPRVAYGTGTADLPEGSKDVLDGTKWALSAGYRHIDCAFVYDNEGQVGQAIEASGVPREQLFITSKLMVSEAKPKKAKILKEQFEKQLAWLKTDYLDLYMMHGPGKSQKSTLLHWSILEDLYEQKKVRAIGVSNFDFEMLEFLVDSSTVKPHYIQNKYDPFHPVTQGRLENFELLQLCNEHNIFFMMYSSIAGWPYILKPRLEPHVVAIAKRLHRSPTQVLLRWGLQLGMGVIPGSVTEKNIVENSKIFDFYLSEAEMREINGLASFTQNLPIVDVHGVGKFEKLTCTAHAHCPKDTYCWGKGQVCDPCMECCRDQNGVDGTCGSCVCKDMGEL